MPTRDVVLYECQDVENAAPFDMLAAVQGIMDLADHQWRVKDGDMELAVIVDNKGSANRPAHLRFLRIRDDAPMALSAARELTALEIDEDQSISEFTYLVIWPNGYMAALASRDAPAHKKIATYFESTSGQETYIVNLFQPDILERLRALREGGLRNVRVKVQASKVAQEEGLRNSRGFGPLFRAGRAADAEVIGIELSSGRGRASRLDDDIALGAEELAQMTDLLETMVVRGRDHDGGIRTINMKKERLRGPLELEPGMSNTEVYTAMSRIRRDVEQSINGLDRASIGS